MADGIKISLEEVTQTAATIRTLNSSMTATLENIKKEMNNLSATWQSEAGEEIRARFNTMSSSFEDYRKKVEAYATFLDDTVDTYVSTEGKVNTNASAFN